MRIAIVHPSRGRAEIAYETACKWLRAKHGDISYNLVIDTTDPELERYKNLFNGRPLPINLIINDNKSAIEAINYGAANSEWDLCVAISDDFEPFDFWDSILREELSGKSDFAVKTKDGIQPVLMTLPIVDRVFYNRYGYIYNPAFQHMYADQELTTVAIMTGKAIFLDLLFEHKHYSTGKFAKDAISIKNDKTYPQGKRVFDEHLRNNFDIVNPVCSYQSIKWH